LSNSILERDSCKRLRANVAKFLPVYPDFLSGQIFFIDDANKRVKEDFVKRNIKILKKTAREITF
jgi:hypothetical protein